MEREKVLVSAEETARQKEYMDKFLYICNYINEHFTDCTYDISPAIEQTGYSKNHFRKLFHDAVGCSPIDFINNRRIEFAKRLLWEKQGNISIKDAALQSGFTDAYYFSRLFKKRENISPSEYQKKVIQTTSVSLQKQ